MHKFRKLSQLKKRRERTLEVRFPCVIKNKKDVENLFVGDFHVKLPRQSSRSCHVIFPTIEEKVENYKLAKNKIVDDKKIVIRSLPELVFRKKTKTRKKIFVPEIEPDIPVTQTVFISNIVNGTKSHEVKGVFPGCVRVTLLKSYNKNFKSAIAKMDNIQTAAKYIKEEQSWPILKGHKLRMKSDTRLKHKKSSTNNIKIYNDSITHLEEHNESPSHVDIQNNNT